MNVKLASFKEEQLPYRSCAAIHVGAAVLVHMARSGRSEPLLDERSFRCVLAADQNMAAYNNYPLTISKQFTLNKIFFNKTLIKVVVNSFTLLLVPYKALRSKKG